MRKYAHTFFYVCCIFIFSLEGKERSIEGETREKDLRQIEEALDWIVPFSSRTFSIIPDIKPIVLYHKRTAIQQFVKKHGYFSLYKPLVGIVTESEEDIAPLKKVFQSLVKGANRQWIQLATDEIITKALAYRNLQKGMTISFPTLWRGKMILVEYKVDEVLDLWQGMPAFGLIPQKKGVSPILLYRGTDFSFISKNSWASILSDFDFFGAGLTTFRFSEDKIAAWLKKVATPEAKAKAMGFSLGGILSVYTAIFQSQWIDGAIAFNTPGVSNSVFNTYAKMNPLPRITLYATQGDSISRVGKMVFSAFELSDQEKLGPIEAHTKIMTASNFLRLLEIDVAKENLSRTQAD